MISKTDRVGRRLARKVRDMIGEIRVNRQISDHKWGNGISKRTGERKDI